MSTTSNRPLILAVDDEASNLQLLRQILQDHYRLLFAKDGSRALELAQKERPDLILLDVMMPGMSGMDVLRQVRADPALADLPTVVMFTAMDDAATRREAADLGAREYVVKGRIDAATLAALVSRHLGPAATAGRG